MKKLIFSALLLIGGWRASAQTAVYVCAQNGAWGVCYGYTNVVACAYNKCLQEGGLSPFLCLSHNGKGYLRAGADGYMVKNTGKAELVKALDTINRGHIYVSPELTPVLLHGLANRKPPVVSKAESLTHRERDVLALIVEGLTNEQIGTKLFLSPLTVKTHRANMLSKLNCTNTAALVRYAIDNKLLDPPPGQS